MSKVISFSISDRYLDKLRTLYPALTDNLAAKQFLTDGLDSSLGNSLDGSLDGSLDDKLKSLIESSLSSTLDDVLDERLDDKLKTIIETSLDDVLDERLDAVMGKSLTSLSERLSRLEERLDDSLDGSLDGSLDVKLDYGLPYQPSKNELTETQRRVLESRQLAEAKLKHHAYLVKHPLVVRDLTKKQPIAVSIETIETADTVETVDTVEIADKVESVDESGTSPLPNQENVETAIETVEAIDEPVTGPIGPVTGDSPQPKNQLSEAVDIENRQGLTNDQLSKKIGIPTSTIEKWKGKIREGKEITSTKYPKFFKQWTLNLDDSLWYEVD